MECEVAGSTPPPNPNPNPDPNPDHDHDHDHDGRERDLVYHASLPVMLQGQIKVTSFLGYG